MKKKIALVALAAAAVGVQAADWSDTSVSLRHGTKFAEPYGTNDITKNIVGLTHVNGYKYGTNFINIDYLMSNSKDPAFKDGSTGATEVYAVYRNTVDLEKATGKSFKTTGIRGLGVTAGVDFNTKTDTGYNSKKQMFVAGPTVFVDVPKGFLNVSLLQLWESNAPSGWSYRNGAYYGVERYSYDPHPMLTAAWAIPFSVGSVPLSFEGYANYIAAKGKTSLVVTRLLKQTLICKSCTTSAMPWVLSPILLKQVLSTNTGKTSLATPQQPLLSRVVKQVQALRPRPPWSVLNTTSNQKFISV